MCALEARLETGVMVSRVHISNLLSVVFVRLEVSILLSLADKRSLDYIFLVICFMLGGGPELVNLI